MLTGRSDWSWFREVVERTLPTKVSEDRGRCRQGTTSDDLYMKEDFGTRVHNCDLQQTALKDLSLRSDWVGSSPGGDVMQR
jgi:hypothetical protein